MQCKVPFFFLFCFSLCGAEHVYLKTPNLSRENILGTTVGIRPYRKSGVRIEAEKFQDKWIIHNYGYGGSGLTLCFGGAKEVLGLLNAQTPASKVVAVLGAGVAGLATAHDLLEQGYEVHIYSDEWSPHLTSNVAAGIWSPLELPEEVSLEKREMNQRMLETSRQRFLESTGEHPPFAGVRFIECYSFKTTSSQEDLKPTHRGEEVIVHLDNGVVKTGRKIHELGLDGKLFVEDLYSKVKAKGAILIQRRFTDLADILSLEEPTIINCTSLGSRELFNDRELIPVRGQMVHFHPDAGMDFLLYQKVPGSSTSWVSIYPWKDRIILGGLYEYGEEEAVVVPEMIDAMIANGEKCLSGQL